MSLSTSFRRGLLLAGGVALLFARRTDLSAAAAAPPAPPPGFSPLDKSKPAESKQDGNLQPHPTAADRRGA